MMGGALDQRIAEFEIAHLHSVFLWPTVAAAAAARRRRVPYIVAPRGMLVKELIRRRSRFAKTIWIHLIERTTLRRAAAIHVTSELESEELRRFGWDLPQIATIANGAEDPGSSAEGEVAKDVKRVAHRQPLILFFGRLSWKKGLDRLLEAFALTRVGHLAVAGTDEENLSARLSQQAAQLGIGHRVSFLPRTLEGADKEHLFGAARLFVLPSYSENFGNTVLEAMWRGLPVVVTPEVGAAEIVRQAGGGAIVVGDAHSLGETLSILIADGGLARNMGESGQRYVQSRYGWAVIAERMEGLYRAIVESSRAEGPSGSALAR
jgi:glycosyltransferase involved in cell wall biosynthesis